jgi:hypothetical protein
MEMFAITDEKQMRRCRYAQLRGFRVIETFGSVSATGYVQSIRPFNPTATRWNITVANQLPSRAPTVIPLPNGL